MTDAGDTRVIDLCAELTAARAKLDAFYARDRAADQPGTMKEYTAITDKINALERALVDAAPAVGAASLPAMAALALIYADIDVDRSFGPLNPPCDFREWVALTVLNRVAGKSEPVASPEVWNVLAREGQNAARRPAGVTG